MPNTLPTLPMGYEQLQHYLPHRYPFMLVDKIIAYDVDAGSITGFKNVSINEPFFQGHFPGNPVMPGVLLLESMAQTAGILAFIKAGISASQGYLFLFAGVEKLRFKRPVSSGDQVMLQAKLCQNRRDIYKFDCVASVADKTVANASITLARQTTTKG